MSRCFPFPPPGYEKKARIDDTDLLTKEKHKENKHKKDKKDKEKREGKEKKDKERSKEKNREKKDRKEKDKDRDRDKEKNRTSDETRVEAQPENSNVEKLGPNSLQNNEIKDSKYVQEFARRIRDEDRAMGSQIVQKVTVTEQRRAELPGRVAENKIGDRSEEKEKEKANNKKEDVRKVNGQRNHLVEARGLENTTFQNFSGMDQRRVEGIAKPMEKKDAGKQMEGKEKNKHRESGSKGDKHKDRDREKKSKSKDKDRDKERKKEKKAKEIGKLSKELPKDKNRDKERKKEEKVKEIGELSKELPKLKEGGKDSLDICIIKTPNLLKTSSKSFAGEGNLGKRKELEINGFLHDNGLRPNKLPRPVSSSHPAMENGRKLEPCQTAIQIASERQGAANNGKGNIKENKINGLIEAQQPNLCPTRPSSSPVQVYENGEASAKPPHPDLKYLSQILSVPKMEELSDLDDQEWLFSSNSLQSKKPKVGSPGVDGTHQVWAEALRIESADVTALPYVIPY